jgi:hypothetical protein
MRKIPNFKSILAAIPHSSSQSIFGAGSFGPTIDEKVIFSDYTARGLAGKFVKAPLLVQ